MLLKRLDFDVNINKIEDVSSAGLKGVGSTNSSFYLCRIRKTSPLGCFCSLADAVPGIFFNLEDFVKSRFKHWVVQKKLKAAVMEYVLYYVVCLLGKALLHIFIYFLPMVLNLNSR